MKNKYKISGLTTVIVLILISYTHCGIETKKFSVKSINSSTMPSDEDHSSSSVGNTVEEQLVKETVDVGVKDFEQLLVSMASLTGVDQNNSNIIKLYASIQTQLPLTNQIKSFAAANQVAIMKLASEFCNETIKSTSLRSNIWPNVNFNLKASQAYSEAGIDTFINNSLSSFMPHLDQFDSEYSEYGKIIYDLTKSLLSTSTDNTTTTRNIAFGSCTTLLASLELTSI